MAQYSEGDIVIECSLETKALLENSKRAKLELVTLGNSGSDAAKGLDKVDESAKNTSDSLGKPTSIAKAVSAALVSSKIIAYAESWNELEDRIQNTGATAEETKDILDKLLATSNRNGRKINESAELYIKLSNSMKELGFNTNDTLDYIDTLSNLMTINKTSVMGAESAINALTKVQMKGKLSGEEANSVFNAMPSILKTLGTQLNKNEAEVRAMAANGELSMKQFSNAMISAKDETAKPADNMRNNVGDGINRIENNLKQFLGELNNATGVTGLLVNSLILVSEHVDIVVTAVGVLAAIYAERYITSISASTFVTLKQAASNLRVASSAGIASVAMKGLSATMNLLGGPAGILLIAAGAFMTWSANADEARRVATDLSLDIDELTKAYQKMNKEQRETEKVKLDNKIAEQMEEITKIQKEITKEQERGTGNSGLALYNDKLNKEKANTITLLNGQLADAKQVIELLQEQMKKYKENDEQAAQATDNLNDSTKELNNTLSQTILDDIASKQAKLNQELEVASLKQDKHNKEAYVYQNVLAVLGKEADKYQSSLLEAAKSGQLFSGHIKDLPPVITNLIATYDELFDASEKNNESLKKNRETSKKASDEITTLKEQLAVAKLEAKGFAVEAKLLAITQQLSADTTGDQVEQIKALIQAQENLSASTEKRRQQEAEAVENRRKLESQSSSGKDFANQQVYSNQSELKQIDIDEQAKLDKLSEWLEAEKQLSELNNTDLLAQEQLYQEAKTAIIDEASKKRQQIEDDEQNKRLQLQSQLLSSTGSIFDGLGGITEAFAGKQNAAYKALYAVSKGFAIADAILNMQVAISKASTLTPPESYAAMATAAAQGGRLVSTISSLTYGGGRELGGNVGANSYYRVGENNKPEILMSGGRQYLIPGESGKIISNKNISGGGQQVNMSFNTAINLGDRSISEDNSQQLAKGLEQVMEAYLQKQMRPGGLLGKR